MIKTKVGELVGTNPVATLDLVWGAAAIGKEIGRTERQAFHLLETGRLPARKVGLQWVAARGELQNFFKTEIVNA